MVLSSRGTNPCVFVSPASHHKNPRESQELCSGGRSVAATGRESLVCAMAGRTNSVAWHGANGHAADAGWASPAAAQKRINAARRRSQIGHLENKERHGLFKKRGIARQVHCRFKDSAIAHVKHRAGHGVKSTARRCAPQLQGWLVPVPDPVASSGDHRSNANSGTPPATAFTKMNGKRRGGEMLS